MKIRALRLYNVGRFENQGMAIEGIEDGVNVLSAANEIGKSTSFEALHALFFHPYSANRKELQRLRPYSGGYPLIEVDITTTQGEFRLSKQFFGKSFAKVHNLRQKQLWLQADAAENFIASLVKDSTGSPAGLLWVPQGLAFMEKPGADDVESRMGLLQSVQGEVEAVTGGRRMDMIMAQVAAELDPLVTKRGAPKVGGSYHQAIELQERLEVEEQHLRGEVTALRQALDDRQKIEKRLLELQNSQMQSERSQEIKAAQSAFEEAKHHQEKIKTALALCDLASHAHELAKQKLENFRCAQAKHLDLKSQEQNLLVEHGELSSRRHQQMAEYERLQSLYEKACTKIQQLRQHYNQAQAVNQFTQLQLQCQQAACQEHQRQQVQQERNALKITPEIFDNLQRLDIEIASLQAKETATNPSFSVHYQEGAKNRLRLNGKDIHQSEEYFYQNQTQIDIPHIGHIILHTRLGSDGGKDLDKKRAEYQSLITQYQIKNLKEARLQLERVGQLDVQLAGLRFSLSQIAPAGLAALQAKCDEVAAMIEDNLAPNSDPIQIESLLLEAEQHQKQVQNDLNELQVLRLRQEQQWAKIKQQLAVLRAELSHLQDIISGNQEQDLLQQFEETALNLSKVTKELDLLQTMTLDIETAKIRLQRLQSADAAIMQEIGSLRENLASFNAAIATHSDQAIEEKWHEAKEALQAALKRREAESFHVAVLTRLAQTLEAARGHARDLYLLPVMRELTPLLQLIFDDMTIQFDEKTCLPQRILRGGRDCWRIMGAKCRLFLMMH